MNIVVLQTNLNKALSIVSKISSQKSELAILSNVLIKAADNTITLTTTNLETAITCKLAGKINKEGSITVPTRLLSEFVNSLPSGNVDMVSNLNKLNISINSYKSVINGLDPEDFPIIPHINTDKKITIKNSDLKTTLQNTLVASSNDDNRPILNGIHIHNADGRVVFAATDSYRLTEATSDTKFTQELNITIPNHTIQELLRIIEPVEDTEIIIDTNQVQFNCGQATIISKTIEGNYPDYKKLIPKESDIVVKINKDELLNVTKIASLFARENAGAITINTDSAESTLSISSAATQVGENSSKVEAKVSNTGKVTLNSKYLIDALNTINSEEIIFRFSEDINPIVISPEDSEDYINIIMPLKS